MRIARKLLPRVEDGLSFLYIEHARIEQEHQAVVMYDASGRVPLPAAALAVLMLGPGTTITHAAVSALCDGGCSIAWCGEGSTRFYAAGAGETQRAANLLAQAVAWADPRQHHEVVLRMYRVRFDETPQSNLNIAQLRGMEGVRVRDTYARLSRETGVAWRGRAYKTGAWDAADPVNRALSVANAALYGVCHAAIVSTGFSAGLGFIHTGKMLAFVYDVADLYKCETTIPAAFAAAVDGPQNIEARARRAARDRFHRARLLERIVPDIQRVLGLKVDDAHELSLVPDETDPAKLWDPSGELRGGHNYAETEDES